MIVSFVNRVIERWKRFVSYAFDNLQNTVKRVAVVLSAAFVIIWIAVLLYASFYHVHVPSASIIRSAHFKFRVCPAGVGMCSFPMANITLGAAGRAEVLGKGQQYRVFLEMEVPDSAPNRDLGMFMVIIKVYDRHGVIVQESSRATALKYQSDLLTTIQTLFWSPLYVLGFFEQKQNLNIELFEEYLDDVYHPAVGVLIEIHSRQLELYSAQLKLHASYSGLRYYMFYWPLTSAFFGICFNCLWLSLLALLSWYKLGVQEVLDEEETKPLTIQQREERVKTLIEGDRHITEDRQRGRGYVQPFTITPACRDTETIGELLLDDEILAGGDSLGEREDTSLLRRRGRPDSAS